jgi:molybdopterin-containing oxidoreductase family membrane subunit
MSALFYDKSAAQNGTVKSVYAHLDSLINAIDQLQKNGVNDFIVTSPLPRHDLEELIYKGKPSPVRWFTLTGALFGGTMGFSLASFTHLNWAMIIPGGKPLVSIPAFIVITFEATVLWGCLFTLIGMVLLTRLPSALKLQVEVCDPRFSDDKFGLIVNSLKRNKAEQVQKILTETGAIEVVNGYAQETVDLSTGAPQEVGLFEPDEISTGVLFKLAIITTVILVLSFFGVQLLFDYTLAGNMERGGYNYSKKAVAPSYQTVK